jgi:hypothetical protein
MPRRRRLASPRSVDSAGKLYVADRGNHTIRVGDHLPIALTNAASRKIHDDLTVFDLPLSLSGPTNVECRTGGSGGDDTVIFTFNHDLASASASVSGGVASVASEPVLAGTQVFVELSAVTNAQTVMITLSGVMDNLGQTLVDTNIAVGYLAGDATGSGIVNASDIGQVKSFSGQAADAANSAPM